jgi:adenine-specific DNA-methyltransferase
MDSRLRVMTICLFDRSVFVIAIDKVEQAKLSELLESLFPDKEKAIVTVQHNPTGQMGDNFAESNQFAYFVYNKIKNVIGMEYRSIEDADTRTFRDNFWKTVIYGTDAANCFYPIFVRDGNIVGFGDVSRMTITQNGMYPKLMVQLLFFPIDNMALKKKWYLSV